MKEGEAFTAHEGIYMNLGERTFWLILSEKLSFSFGFFILALILSFVRKSSFVSPDLVRSIGLLGIAAWAAFFVFLIAAFIASRLVYRNNAFAFSEDALKIRRGVFTKLEIAIPYRQVQNVEIERTLIQQMMGISKVVIITAGTDNPATSRDESSCTMPVIDKDIAIGLQNELLRRADVQKVVEAK
jgi:uncharacterized membrane protein YdbT with pleckstrin-like domain